MAVERLEQVLRANYGDRFFVLYGAGVQDDSSTANLHKANANNELFGNAGDMREMADALEIQRDMRVTQQQLETDEPLGVEDVPELYQQYLTSPDDVSELEAVMQELDGMVGLAPVKDFIRRQIYRLQL